MLRAKTKAVAVAVMLNISIVSIPLAQQSSKASDMIHDRAMKYCRSTHTVARAVMNARQVGVSLQEALSVVNTDETRSLTTQAYSMPRYSTEVFQIRAIEDFSNDAFLDCYTFYVDKIKKILSD